MGGGERGRSRRRGVKERDQRWTFGVEKNKYLEKDEWIQESKRMKKIKGIHGERNRVDDNGVGEREKKKNRENLPEWKIGTFFFVVFRSRF